MPNVISEASRAMWTRSPDEFFWVMARKEGMSPTGSTMTKRDVHERIVKSNKLIMVLTSARLHGVFMDERCLEGGALCGIMVP